MLCSIFLPFSHHSGSNNTSRLSIPEKWNTTWLAVWISGKMQLCQRLLMKEPKLLRHNLAMQCVWYCTESGAPGGQRMYNPSLLITQCLQLCLPHCRQINECWQKWIYVGMSPISHSTLWYQVFFSVIFPQSRKSYFISVLCYKTRGLENRVVVRKHVVSLISARKALFILGWYFWAQQMV